MVVLYSERNRKTQLFSIPILYLLFCVYLLGGIWGAISANSSETLFSVTTTQLSAIDVFLRCFILYASIMVFSKSCAGVFLIPAVLLVRGFTFVVSIICFLQWSERDIAEVMIVHGLSVLIQIFPMFYLATILFALSYRRIGSCSIKSEYMKEIRFGMMYAVIATVLCTVIAFF